MTLTTAEPSVELLSALLLDIHRLSIQTNVEQFQSRVLETAAAQLGFDSAVWGTGVMSSLGPIVHSATPFAQPPEMMENYERIKQFDTLGLRAFQNLGVTINAARDVPPWNEQFSEPALDHMRRFGMAHLMATTTLDPVLQLFNSVAFYRSDVSRPFTEAERQFKQALMPHLVETWRVNRFHALRGTGPLSSGERALALCDRQGFLHAASTGFASLMQREWPDFKGPELPGALREPGVLTKKIAYRGVQVIIASSALPDLTLISVRMKSLADGLTARELEVARRFGSGAGYRAIALALHVSPSTVRNHLQTVYTKLGISNKLELAGLLREIE